MLIQDQQVGAELQDAGVTRRRHSYTVSNSVWLLSRLLTAIHGCRLSPRLLYGKDPLREFAVVMDR